jgi:truncated hemoglobin YjbI
VPAQLILFDKLGKNEGVKNMAEILMKKVMADNNLCKHFDKENLEIHKDKLAYYLGYLSGGHPNWIG